MNIEVGEWVKTKDGYLGKLIAINKQDYNYLVIDTSRNIRNTNKRSIQTKLL